MENTQLDVEQQEFLEQMNLSSNHMLSIINTGGCHRNHAAGQRPTRKEEKKRLVFDMVDNGQDAVEYAIENAYDLILMDIQMPILDGLEATRQIRSRSDIRQPRIIAVTAFDSWEVQEASQAAGMDGFVAKPITLEVLEKVLDERQWDLKDEKPEEK